MARLLPHFLLLGLIGKASCANTDQEKCSGTVGTEEACLLSSKAKTNTGRLLLAKRRDDPWCLEFVTGVCPAIAGATDKEKCNSLFDKKNFNTACETAFQEKKEAKQCKDQRGSQKKACVESVDHHVAYTGKSCIETLELKKKNSCSGTCPAVSPGNPTWYWVEAGTQFNTCEAFCASRGEICEEGALNAVDSEDALKCANAATGGVLGSLSPLNCQSFMGSSSESAPFSRDQTCYYQTSSAANCNKPTEDLSTTTRLCACLWPHHYAAVGRARGRAITKK